MRHFDVFKLTDVYIFVDNSERINEDFLDSSSAASELRF